MTEIRLHDENGGLTKYGAIAMFSSALMSRLEQIEKDGADETDDGCMALMMAIALLWEADDNELEKQVDKVFPPTDEHSDTEGGKE